MGTSTVTLNTAESRIQSKHAKDLKTTTCTLGFRVTAYIIKDDDGNLVEKVVKPHSTVKAEHVPEIFRKIFSFKNQINREAAEFCLKRLTGMIEFYKTINSR